jgi:hypothetical protein
MTQTVVTDANQTVVVRDPPQTVVVREPQNRVIAAGLMGPPGAATFGELRDIDLTQLSAGSLLVYNTQTSKWTATTLLDQQTVESGQF